MTEPQDRPPDTPLSDELEMELRDRLVVLEQRINLAVWLAIAAEVGVIALAAILTISAWRGGRE